MSAGNSRGMCFSEEPHNASPGMPWPCDSCLYVEYYCLPPKYLLYLQGYISGALTYRTMIVIEVVVGYHDSGTVIIHI